MASLIRQASRRGVLAGAGAGVAAVLAAACGAGGAASGGSTGAQPGATRAPNSLSGTVQWQIRDNPEYGDLSKWAVTEFTKRFPNVKVEASPNNVGNTEKTIAQMVAGSGPDVFQGWGRLQVQYASKGATMNLADLAKQLPPADVSDFVDAQWRGMVVPTTQFRYGMPTYVNMFVMYYSTGIFQERGVPVPTADWTHDTYADNLKKLTFTRGETPVWGGFGNLTIPDRQYHVKAFGGHFVDPNNFGKTALDNEASLKGMQWVYDRLFTDKTFAPIDSSKRTWSPNSQQDGFLQGALATFEDGLDKLNTVASRFTGTGFNIMHIPKGPAARSSLITTDSWAMWKNTKVKDAAWELMQFITGKDFYDQQSKALAYIPSRKSQLDGWVALMKGKGPGFTGVDYKVVTDALTGANGMSYLTVDEVFQCQKEAEDVLQPALNAVLTTGEKVPTYFRDIKGQIDAAAGGCGAKYT